MTINDSCNVNRKNWVITDHDFQRDLCLTDFRTNNITLPYVDTKHFAELYWKISMVLFLSVLRTISRDLDQQSTQISSKTCSENSKYLINTYINQHKTTGYINKSQRDWRDHCRNFVIKDWINCWLTKFNPSRRLTLLRHHKEVCFHFNTTFLTARCRKG